MTYSKIYLRGVRAYGYVGLLPEENVLGQWFEVDAELWVDFSKAAQNDSIEDTIDYRRCITTIENLIKTSKFALIERLAGAIVTELLTDKKITKALVKVIKHPPIPDFQGSVAVEICQENTPEIPSDHDSITSIYADGSCLQNPGPGGWGVVVNFADGTSQEMGGSEPETTNNQMELQAAISALEFCASYNQKIPLYTDSRYVKDGITQWIHGWKKNGWKTKDKQPVKNKELWQKLDELNNGNIDWRWVEGHSGDKNNDRCDQIARTFAQGDTPMLVQRTHNLLKYQGKS
ncbi:MAG: ribonuclease HI [Cyanobacteria bacterium M5B4]|nr:ribonuclease HI [Cyanobacteria bacterium KgW148]PLS68395.1 MAG: ribonuclease HI [Cyanobacteria bacterium M5B4]